MKIGIYGGTFSPPHIGHVGAAKEFVRALELDKLLVIPTFIPPHKTESERIAPKARAQMCEIAFGELGAEISDIEISRGGKSYTVDTLHALREKYPDDEFFLLCGTDMILTFDGWYRFEDILSEATLVYVRRENDPDTERAIGEKISLFKEQFGARIRHITPRTVELSSSEIRARIKKREDVSHLLPEGIAEFIKDNKLYV